MRPSTQIQAVLHKTAKHAFNMAQDVLILCHKSIGGPGHVSPWEVFIVRSLVIQLKIMSEQLHYQDPLNQLVCVYRIGQ